MPSRNRVKSKLELKQIPPTKLAETLKRYLTQTEQVQMKLPKERI